MLETLTGDVMEFKIRDALALSYFQEAVILYEEKVERSLNIADDSCNNVINKCVDHSLNISSELLDVFQVCEFQFVIKNGLIKQILLP